MNSSVRNWRVLAAISAGSLVLAACGGGNDGNGDNVAASAAPSAATSGAAAPSGPSNVADGELVIGTLLPQTGSLASLGPPEFAGVKLAVKDINEAGGVGNRLAHLTHQRAQHHCLGVVVRGRRVTHG